MRYCFPHPGHAKKAGIINVSFFFGSLAIRYLLRNTFSLLLIALYLTPFNSTAKEAGKTILATDSVTIRGTVKDAKSKQKLPGTSLLINNRGIGVTDKDGKFSIMLPADCCDGVSVITARMVGYKEGTIKIRRKYRRKKMKIYLSINTTKKNVIICDVSKPVSEYSFHGS